ncbi:MAG: zf-HC2 domain-containing protein [Liquorilactobacillus sp.]|uniref:zf-HC2 domain-containing protein n=1 Tax=Liquorilactobacillus sp. TaxID=2767923 RepID=UPI0039E88520
MKVTCDVIRDLIPLYVENMLSDDSRKLVEEHLANCPDCKQLLKSEEYHVFVADTDEEKRPLVKIRKMLQKKRLLAIIISFLVATVFMTLIFAYLMAPEYLKNGQENVTVEKINDGKLLLNFGKKVNGYEIIKTGGNQKSGYIYSLTTWRTIWDSKIRKQKAGNVILNAKGENVKSIYYYHEDGSEDKLIYGKELYKNGGSVTLPRLFLMYYLLVAIGLTIIGSILLFVFRKRDNLFKKVLYIWFIPLCYIAADLMINGLTQASYSAEKNFLAILLVMMILYLIILASIKLFQEHKINHH